MDDTVDEKNGDEDGQDPLLSNSGECHSELLQCLENRFAKNLGHLDARIDGAGCDRERRRWAVSCQHLIEHDVDFARHVLAPPRRETRRIFRKVSH